jgi:hypothetical protein
LLGGLPSAGGSFVRPIDDIVSFMALPNSSNNSTSDKDYPWRRGAFDRTLTCPDLARVINDYLSRDVEFAANEDMPATLCA